MSVRCGRTSWEARTPTGRWPSGNSPRSHQRRPRRDLSNLIGKDNYWKILDLGNYEDSYMTIMYGLDSPNILPIINLPTEHARISLPVASASTDSASTLLKISLRRRADRGTTPRWISTPTVTTLGEHRTYTLRVCPLST